jgi:HAD superfamily hydrolase (TIGR01549 family)
MLKRDPMKTKLPAGPAILFDLDGTLVDTVYQHVVAWSVSLRWAGLAIPNWKIHRHIGMSGRSMVRQLLREQEAGKRHVDVDKVEKRHDAEFKNATGDLLLLPGADELLRFLTRRSIPWAIATTGGRGATERLLQHLKIQKNTVVVTGDDVQKAKPSPDIFVTAAERLGLSIEDCIVVGDSVWDMLAAGRKRALAVGLLSGGYSREELGLAGAFRVYNDPADMLLRIEDLGI